MLASSQREGRRPAGRRASRPNPGSKPGLVRREGGSTHRLLRLGGLGLAHGGHPDQRGGGGGLGEGAGGGAVAVGAARLGAARRDQRLRARGRRREGRRRRLGAQRERAGKGDGGAGGEEAGGSRAVAGRALTGVWTRSQILCTRGAGIVNGTAGAGAAARAKRPLRQPRQPAARRRRTLNFLETFWEKEGLRSRAPAAPSMASSARAGTSLADIAAGGAAGLTWAVPAGAAAGGSRRGFGPGRGAGRARESDLRPPAAAAARPFAGRPQKGARRQPRSPGGHRGPPAMRLALQPALRLPLRGGRSPALAGGRSHLLLVRVGERHSRNGLAGPGSALSINSRCLAQHSMTPPSPCSAPRHRKTVCSVRASGCAQPGARPSALLSRSPAPLPQWPGHPAARAIPLHSPGSMLCLAGCPAAARPCCRAAPSHALGLRRAAWRLGRVQARQARRAARRARGTAAQAGWGGGPAADGGSGGWQPSRAAVLNKCAV